VKAAETEFEVSLATYPAPIPEATLAERIEQHLLDNGIEGSRQLILDLERLLDVHAYRLAAEGLRRILRAIGERTPSMCALERVILGPSASLAADAVAVGCSRQNLQRHEARLRKALRRLTEQTRVSIDGKPRNRQGRLTAGPFSR
jgi:hypothetical protein